MVIEFKIEIEIQIQKRKKLLSTHSLNNLVVPLSRMTARGPVLYRTSSNKWEIGYKFDNKIEAINYLINQNDEECYDVILDLNKNQRIIIPLKSLFNKFADKQNICQYKIVKHIIWDFKLGRHFQVSHRFFFCG